MISTRSCVVGETTSAPVTPPSSSVRLTTTYTADSAESRLRSGAGTYEPDRLTSGRATGFTSEVSTGFAAPFAIRGLRNHVKRSIGKPWAGEPHARIERGIGKQAHTGTAPLTTNDPSKRRGQGAQQPTGRDAPGDLGPPRTRHKGASAVAQSYTDRCNRDRAGRRRGHRSSVDAPSRR